MECNSAVKELDNKESFNCKVCGFRSRNKNGIKLHVLEHVDKSLPLDSEDSVESEIENT